MEANGLAERRDDDLAGRPLGQDMPDDEAREVVLDD
jgi:hypothetical protein